VQVEAQRMLEMIRGYWVSQIVGTLARLGIPDRLAASPLHADEVARAAGCDPGATHRLLRAAASLDLTERMPDGRFALASTGALLRTGVPGSMADLAMALTAPGHWQPWGQFTEAVREGRSQARHTLGREVFDYYAENPEEGASFTRAMADLSALVAGEAARLIDTSSARLAVDVGGASGAIVGALLAANPGLTGAIVDLPHAAGEAARAIAERGQSARCAFVPGDFFASLPEADVCLLKNIIHDWDDASSVHILSNCARAMRPDGRVYLIECVVPEAGDATFAVMLDLNMLAMVPGRERTQPEYAALLEQAGLRLDHAMKTASPFDIIVATSAAG
jgi:SAM-dependent methyltransferase